MAWLTHLRGWWVNESCWNIDIFIMLVYERLFFRMYLIARYMSNIILFKGVSRRVCQYEESFSGKLGRSNREVIASKLDDGIEGLMDNLEICRCVGGVIECLSTVCTEYWMILSTRTSRSRSFVLLRILLAVMYMSEDEFGRNVMFLNPCGIFDGWDTFVGWRKWRGAGWTAYLTYSISSIRGPVS